MAAVDGPLWEEIGRELVLAVRAGRLVARPAEARVEQRHVDRGSAWQF
jgi:hypothetical protein